MMVIAEGIESKADATMLAAAACPIGQGYLYGRPAPASQLGPTLVAWASARTER